GYLEGNYYINFVNGTLIVLSYSDATRALQGLVDNAQPHLDPGIQSSLHDQLQGTTPTATLTGLHLPAALAFDSHDNLFVTNPVAGTVSEFAPCSTTATATRSGLNGPFALACDSSGNLFVTGNGTVSEFAPGSTTPTGTLPGLNTPVALA